MTDPAVVDSLERIIIAGVALTTVAIAVEPGFDLTFPQWRVLVILGATPDGLRIGEVSRQIGVTLPATSRQLRRLERRGLVTLTRDSRDRRAAVASLTDVGLDTRSRIMAHRRSRIATAVAAFESDRRLRGQLDGIAAALGTTR